MAATLESSTKNITIQQWLLTQSHTTGGLGSSSKYCMQLDFVQSLVIAAQKAWVPDFQNHSGLLSSSLQHILTLFHP